VVGKLTKPGGRWSYKLHTRIPRVLQVVAGIPIALRELHIKVGAPRKVWIATTSCARDERWRYHVLITFTTGQTKTYDDSVPAASAPARRGAPAPPRSASLARTSRT
jgi:hypothetical protein